MIESLRRMLSEPATRMTWSDPKFVEEGTMVSPAMGRCNASSWPLKMTGTVPFLTYDFSELLCRCPSRHLTEHAGGLRW
jgi:hypothetical protein